MPFLGIVDIAEKPRRRRRGKSATSKAFGFLGKQISRGIKKRRARKKAAKAAERRSAQNKLFKSLGVAVGGGTRQ